MNKTKLQLVSTFLIVVVAFYGCRRSTAKQSYVVIYKPGDSAYDERGICRREYVMDSSKKIVYGVTDFLNDAEIFKLGIIRVHYEFGEDGLLLSRFESGTFNLKSYSLIEFFDEDDQLFKCARLKSGQLRFFDYSGTEVDEIMWGDRWPRDGSILGWDTLWPLQGSNMFAAENMPRTFQKENADGKLVERGQGYIWAEKPVLSLNRVFGNVGLHYANIAFSANGNLLFVVYFERYRVYFNHENPLFAVDERNGLLLYVYDIYEYKGSTAQEPATIIWRKRVDANGKFVGQAIADVFSDSDERVVGKKKAGILSNIPEPSKGLQEKYSRTMTAIDAMEKHVPLIPRE